MNADTTTGSADTASAEAPLHLSVRQEQVITLLSPLIDSGQPTLVRPCTAHPRLTVTINAAPVIHGSYEVWKIYTVTALYDTL